MQLTWINCKEKMPPQNKLLLWCWFDLLKTGEWNMNSVRTGIYRFGEVEGLGTISAMLENGHRIYWAEFEVPHIAE